MKITNMTPCYDFIGAEGSYLHAVECGQPGLCLVMRLLRAVLSCSGRKILMMNDDAFIIKFNVMVFVYL